MKSDIATREDCERLVRSFYEQALVDPVIGFLFTEVAKVDMAHHVPRITRFWETVLLGAQSYGGGAFRPHIELNRQVTLRRGHFERWLWLWQQTVDQLFAGEVAEEAKRHAVRVAGAFYERLQAPSQGEAGLGELLGELPQGGGGLRITRGGATPD
jgi:hemoglobin